MAKKSLTLLAVAGMALMLAGCDDVIAHTECEKDEGSDQRPFLR